MTTDEDVLLREVDETLQQDRQLAFFKTYGPWVGAVALAAVIGVGINQVRGSLVARDRAAAAETYREAVSDAAAPDEATAAIEAILDEVDGGYRGLSLLRQASLKAAAGDTTGAIAAYQSAYNQSGLPTRFTDFARLRAAYLLAGTSTQEAVDVAEAVSTPALRPYAEELIATITLETGDYDVAASQLEALVADPDAPSSVAARAQYLLTVADAGRRGIALEPEANATADVLNELTRGLTQPQQVPTEADTAPTDDAEE